MTIEKDEFWEIARYENDYFESLRDGLDLLKDELRYRAAQGDEEAAFALQELTSFEHDGDW